MQKVDDAREQSCETNIDASRRHFLSFLPLGVFAGISLTFSAAAKRFLEASASSLADSKAVLGRWIAIGPLADLGGNEPIRRSIPVEHKTGWAISTKQEVVYVLPKHDHMVVSAICPHEGCPVLWDDQAKNFLCPCHDSRFSDRGTRLTGPASSDLAAVPTRVEDGVISVQLSA
jgi:Rieske Fe-S protein